ncbi:MAG TPA: type III-B CRISPR module RAMP protein Cmr1 [Alphaproteobacteria bacterium]|nr:type III-B CRISPR module RAMP protein Cmr1 [Alphaproteobacteria bacterium]
MAQIKSRLETVTPLFMGGADPRDGPELRPASFRGVLRFWWRALLAGVMGDADLEALRQEETAVFGQTENGSPIVVRVLGQARPQSALPHQPGVGYLWWSMVRTKRQYLPAGTSFTLILQTRPGVRSDEPLKRTLVSLWLLTHLGGIGSRARRGGGSVQVTNVQGQLPSGVPDLQVRAQAPQQLRDELANGLKQLRTLVSIGSPNATISPPANFDVLHPDACRILVLNKTWSTWEQALEEVGQKFQTFRNRRPPDYQRVKGVVSGTSHTLQPVERAAFGLPIVFYYRSLAGRSATLEGETHDRRASPLLMRVVRLASGQHTVVMTVFKAALLEKGERLKLRQRGGPLVSSTAPGIEILDTFLNDLGRTIPLLEVSHR